MADMNKHIVVLHEDIAFIRRLNYVRITAIL